MTRMVLSICIIAALGRPTFAAEPRPNVLLILADDLKYHDLGFTGSPDVPTPHLDALAASGVHFTHAYCSAPLCAPSRAGLLTGRNQARFGFDYNPEPHVAEDQGNRLQHPDRLKNGLPQTEKTIAAHLKSVGYQTAWIGKWHLGEAAWAQPKSHGFDHCYGFLPGVQSYRPMTALEAKRAGDVPPLNHCLLDDGKWVKNTGNLTDMLGAEAARYIDSHRESPWFMYCAFNAPHGPLQHDPVRDPKFAHIADESRRRLVTTLVALDDAVGTIVRSLHESGQWKRTLVVFASDHGVGSAGEWGGGKGTMLEGGLRSLLLVSWPGRVPKDTRRDDRVSFLDLAPTILSAAGITAMPEMKLDGIDLLRVVKSNEPTPNRPLAWRMDDGYAFRDEGDWKLVGNAARQFLFDLKSDPLERNDLAQTNPQKLAELAARWKRWNAENPPPMWRAVTEGATKPSGAENRKRREAVRAMPDAITPPADPRQPKKAASQKSAVGSGPLSSAELLWHLEDSAARNGGDAFQLSTQGRATLGVPLLGEDHTASLRRGGDGFAARLDGGYFTLGGTDRDVFGSRFDGEAYTLHLRVKPSGATLDGCLFSRWAGREQMPVDFSAWRMPWGHLGTHGIAFRTSFHREAAAGQAAVLDFFCPTPQPLTDWLDLTVRLTPQRGGPGLLDLFVNGQFLFRNAEKLPGGLPFEFFLHETPGAFLGAEPGGRRPFRGLIDHAAIWTRALSDAEVLALAGRKHSGEELKPQRVHPRDALGQYHFAANTPAAERADLTNEALKRAIAHQIEHDPWYPQYHLALVGLVCNLQSLYFKGRHHYLLVHRGEALHHNEVFRHLVSDDLVNWDIRPAPFGWPHPVWPNGTLLVGPDGKPSLVGGYPITLATAEDDDLDAWKVRNDEVRITQEHPRYVADPKSSPGKLSWEEGVTWRDGDTYYMAGGGSHWDAVDPTGRLKRHHHDVADYDFTLYRSSDLREWRHVGSFFKNPDPEKLNLGVECGQMIPFADGRLLWDFTHHYLVGRMQGDRFRMLHHGELASKGNFVHWGGWERDDAGRILVQTTKILKLPVPELARLGWGRTHRLPLVATLTDDHRLLLQPAEAIEKLRARHVGLEHRDLLPDHTTSFDMQSAHQEVRITFAAASTGRIGIRLSDGLHHCDVYHDAATQQLVFDSRVLPAEARDVPNDRRLFAQPLHAEPGKPITLRLFQDGALTEVFAGDVNGAHWSWFEHPDRVQAAVFTRGTPATMLSADAWELNSIWKKSP